MNFTNLLRRPEQDVKVDMSWQRRQLVALLPLRTRIAPTVGQMAPQINAIPAFDWFSAMQTRSNCHCHWVYA